MQEARQYYVQLSVHDEGLGSRDEGNACRPEEVARTETAPLAINPDFMNRVFVMRLQQSLGVSLRPRSLLNVQLWAKPIMERGKCHVRPFQIHCLCHNMLQQLATQKQAHTPYSSSVCMCE